MTSAFIDQLSFDDRGLIPVIVQQVGTHEVLMLAYMNAHTVELTLETGKATYWSRSRNSVWIKGETSGHTQKGISLAADCDKDTLLMTVEQTGPACHTGSHTCFDDCVETV